MKEEALKYLQAGFSPIPLGEITKDEAGSKKIVYPISWKKYETVRPTEEEISQWDYPNMGIVTGRVSNLLVLDVDSYKPNYDADLIKSFNIPVTPVQETANGGRQYFFRYPIEIDIHNAVCIGHEGSGIDIRGDGGMVIVPPTKTSYGAYTWQIDPFNTPLSDIPPALFDILVKNHSNESKERKSIVELSGLAKGEGRDNSLATLCGTLAYSLHPNRWPTEIFPTMMAINNTYKPPLPIKDLQRIYKSITEKELRRRNNVKEIIKDDKNINIFTPAMSFNDLMVQDFPKARYTVEPFFEASTLNMISAPPNTWKSWLLFYFASHIVDGTKIFENFLTEKSKVMIVNEEDSHRSVQDRFKMLGINKKELPIYLHIAKGLVVDQKFVDGIIKECKENDISVLMLDSLRAVHLADENSSTEMQIVLNLLKQITKNGITVIFTHHNRKKGPFDKADSAELSRGSTAINAAISGHISLEEEVRDGDKFLIIRHLKSKAGPKHDPIEIEIENEEEDKIRFVFKGDFKERENKIRHTKESVYNVLFQGGWKSVNDLIEVGIKNHNYIRESLVMLKKENLIISMTRKSAEEKKLVSVGQGKANEMLYAYNKKSGVVDELDEFSEEVKKF